MKNIKQRLREAHSASQFIPTGNSTIYGDALNSIEELEAEYADAINSMRIALEVQHIREAELDQLREQVKMLREVVNDALSGMGGGYAIWSPRAQEALDATEPKE